ncbi:MAG: hypothetical protein CMD81_03285 [Gammaproteobacteria bacterium]|nr:hypothetical protein [Gammaproteobacteria bacterium]
MTLFLGMRAEANAPCPRRLTVNNEEGPKYPSRKLARIGHDEGTEKISDSENKKGRPVTN